MQDKSTDPRTYASIINVLIPLYLVIALGYIAGALCYINAQFPINPCKKLEESNGQQPFAGCNSIRFTNSSNIAGRYKMADEFMMDRLNSFNAKFALPGDRTNVPT